MMLPVDQNVDAASFEHRALSHFTHGALAAFHAVMMTSVGFEHKSLEVAEVVVDEALDFTSKLFDVVIVVVRRRLRRRQVFGKARDPAGGRGEDLPRVAAKPLYPSRDIVDVP